jgi:hypothetical protein
MLRNFLKYNKIQNHKYLPIYVLFRLKISLIQDVERNKDIFDCGMKIISANIFENEIVKISNPVFISDMPYVEF